MQKSVDNKETAMKALIVTPQKLAQVTETFSKIQRGLPDGHVAQLSNINSRTQIVVSGTLKGVDIAASILQSKGLSGRAIPLPVSAPFHCELMGQAALDMQPAIDATEFKMPVVSVISNVTAKPVF